MLSFRQFINLFEAKLDDIIKGHVNKGHAHEEVKSVITRALAANKKGAKIDISSPFDRVKNAVEQHEQKQASKSDIQTIHHDPKTGVTIKQVNTKDASIEEYGHGKTKWCVAATGENNRFELYGKGGNKFFTIHHKNPETGEENVYGAHGYEEGIIRNIENKSVKPPDDVYKAMAKTPELSKINILSQNPHFTEEHITNVLKDHTDGTAARVALQYHQDKIQPHHIDLAVQHPNGEVAKAAFKYHKDKIQSHHIDMALQHPEGEVAYLTLKDHANKIQPHHIDMAMKHPNGEVPYTAFKYHAKKIQPHHIDMALQHPNGLVARAALHLHKDKIQPHHIDMALQHPKREVARAALEYQKDKIKPHHEEIARRRGLL